MSTGAEVGQYILQTRNSKTIRRFNGGNLNLQTIPLGMPMVGIKFQVQKNCMYFPDTVRPYKSTPLVVYMKSHGRLTAVAT